MQNAGLGGWPYRRAQLSPGRTALIYDGLSTSYAELAVRISKLADQLRSAGVKVGDRVAYLGPNHPAFVETMFATHLLGGIFVPLNFRLAAPELDYLLADSGPAVLVYAPSCAPVVRALSDPPGCRVALEQPGAGEAQYEEWLAGGSAASIDEPVAMDDVALILYTSGTTGRPKGAMLTHANLIWNTANLLIGVDVAADEVTLVTAPLFHVAALGQTLLPTFAKSGCAVLTSSWDVDGCYDLIEKHGVTWMFGVATMYAELAGSPRWPGADLTSLRSLMCGGAPVSETLIRVYQERGLVFCQGYGLTETAPGATFLEAGESARKAGSVGAPVFFGQVKVVRPDLTEVAQGEPGEVLIRGANVTPGYWNAPEATAAALTEDGWFHSGDIATVDADGYLFIVDRVKDMFVSGGENVYPAEVEKAVADHPAVLEVAVVGVPDGKWGEVGRAFVVCRVGAELTRAELREFLGARLAKYKIPVHLTVVDSLPKTGSGKIQKSGLRKLPLA
jgi:fatty-acyl-CoA synthase